MRRAAVSLLFLAIMAGSGCVSRYRLPAIASDELFYRRTDPLGGTTVTAQGVQVTEFEVTAESVEWVTAYPSFNVSLTVKGYRRERTKKDAAD
jgi:hypothetical protein